MGAGRSRTGIVAQGRRMNLMPTPRRLAAAWLRYAGGLLALLGTQTAKPASAAAQNAVMVTGAVLQAARQTAPDASSISLGPVQGAQFMQDCRGPLTVTITGVEPYEQAAAHCASPGWTLYVTVTVTATSMVVVTAKPVAAGQVLQPQDLTLTRELVASYAGRVVYDDPAGLIGTDALMSLPAGTILTSDAIQQPTIVQAGQTVSVDVQSGGVDISILATADQSGRIGDTILMTNRSSGKRFSALVTAGGPVVQLPG